MKFTLFRINLLVSQGVSRRQAGSMFPAWSWELLQLFYVALVEYAFPYRYTSLLSVSLFIASPWQAENCAHSHEGTVWSLVILTTVLSTGKLQKHHLHLKDAASNTKKKATSYFLSNIQKAKLQTSLWVILTIRGMKVFHESHQQSPLS